MMRRRKISRRAVLKGAAAAAAVPYFVPGSSLGRDGTPAPSERLTLGFIGLGSMGMRHIKGFLFEKDCRITAVCDVDASRRQAAIKEVTTHYGTKRLADYNDFEGLLAHPDLDTVCISVPDHWHSVVSIRALAVGKDVYGEKPLALTIAEGRAMVEAVKRYDRIWQMGSWQRSTAHFRHACELVRNGRIGKVQRVEVGLPSAPTIESQPTMPVPAGLDYPRWLGPAPWAPYTEKRCHWNFRWILDYSGGQVTDTGAHDIDIAHWGMGLDHTGPVEVEGAGEFPADGLWDVATEFKFRCLYAKGASPMCPGQVEIVVASKKHLPGGTRFIGEDGWIRATRSGNKASSPGLLRERIGPGEIRLDTGRGEHRQGHRQNFLDAVRRRIQPVTPIEIGHRSITPAHLGNIAMLLGRKVRFNAQTERFVNDPQADRMLSRGMRSPWTMEG